MLLSETIGECTMGTFRSRSPRKGQQRSAISERRASRTIGRPRWSKRQPKVMRYEDAVLSVARVQAGRYGRYRYSRITEFLRADGWRVNAKRVQRNLAARGA
jgi:putative transposase